jgi:hypothetical protein
MPSKEIYKLLKGLLLRRLYEFIIIAPIHAKACKKPSAGYRYTTAFV